MKQKRSRSLFFIGSILLLNFIIIGCKGLLFDDLSDCPQGVFLKIYSQAKSCEKEVVYRDFKKVSVFVFDEAGTFVDLHSFDSYNGKEQKEIFVPIKKDGKYELLVWTNLDSPLILKELKKGLTKKKDLFLSLAKSENTKDLLGKEIFATPLGESIHIEVGARVVRLIHTSINVCEITNRINIRVTGLDDPSRYEALLYLDNANYNFLTEIQSEKPREYRTDQKIVPNEKFPNEKDIFTQITTLKIDGLKEGDLILRGADKKEVVFKENLIQEIKKALKKENLNFACQNDYDLVIKMDKGPKGYYAVSVWVNGWLVHSYDIEL